jgi:hypothetical protein
MTELSTLHGSKLVYIPFAETVILCCLTATDAQVVLCSVCKGSH